MLELVFISILIIICFIAITWFAIKRSEKRNHAFMVNLAESLQPEKNGGDSFTKILDEVLTDEEIVELDSLDKEPKVTISSREIDTLNQISEHKNDTVKSEIDIMPRSELPPNTASVKEHDTAQNTSAEMVIAFTVMASEGEMIVGSDLKMAFEHNNLVFGNMGVYHKMNVGTQKVSLFSIANILEPGTFNPDNISSMTTPGIILFATLPSVINSLALFDELYETSSQLAHQLSGVLSDQSRQPISESKLEEMRSRIFSFNLSLQTEQHNQKHDHSY